MKSQKWTTESQPCMSSGCRVTILERAGGAGKKSGRGRFATGGRVQVMCHVAMNFSSPIRARSNIWLYRSAHRNSGRWCCFTGLFYDLPGWLRRKLTETNVFLHKKAPHVQ